MMSESSAIGSYRREKPKFGLVGTQGLRKLGIKIIILTRCVPETVPFLVRGSLVNHLAPP